MAETLDLEAVRLELDELTFEVRRSPRRKTLEVIVDRGGELILAVPTSTDDAAIAEFVRERRFWLFSKLAEKELHQQPPPSREFVTGEGFMYLGKSYRLLLVERQGSPLILHAGRFRLIRSEAERGREHFIQWYSAHAKVWLKSRLKDWTVRLDAKPKDLKLRDLGYRWGSCTQGGTLNFHWAVILLPANVVDYVIVHELAHLHEPNHTPEFWGRVERAMPDYEQRKLWLAERGGEYVVL